MNEITINKFELPNLEIKDYEQILELAKEDTEKYKNYIVTPETLTDDTKKRAELRNYAKAINSRRLEIEKEISKPIKEFKSKCDVLVDLYNSSAELIDNQIKVFEEKEKEERKAIIAEIFSENVKELKEVLSLDKIFDDKWLNKGSWKEDNTFRLENDLIAKIEVIRQDLITISELNSKYEVELKNDYLNHFQLGEVIRKNNDLIQKEELLKKQKEESEKVIEEKKEEQVQEMLIKEVKQEDIDPIKTYTLKITGPLSKQKALKQFLDLNNMKYEKI